MNYIADTEGRIYNEHGHELKPWKNNKGYMYFKAYSSNKEKKNISVHKFVWTYFKGEIPEGFEINHKNNNKEDNRLENLEILTPLENNRLREYVKLTYDMAQTIRAKYRTGLYSYRDLGNEYNVHRSHICKIINNHYWL